MTFIAVWRWWQLKMNALQAVVVLHSSRFPMKGILFTRERKQNDTTY